MPDDWDYSTRRPAAPPVPLITYGLCVMCVLITAIYHFTEPGANTPLSMLARIASPTPANIWDGVYFGLLTSFFPHADLMHLVFNMMWLYQLGCVIEAELTPWAYFLFLVTSCAVSMGCELAFTSGAGSIGASGVVYAMFGLMWAGRSRYASWWSIATRRNLNIFLIWGVFCVFATYAGFMAVANIAHASGMLFGLGVGSLLLSPRPRRWWIAVLALMTALTVCSTVWLPWNGEWYYYKAGKAFRAQQYSTAIGLYHRSLRLGGPRYSCWENIARCWGNIAVDAEGRNDQKGYLEALRQAESARSQEGPEPSANGASGPPTTMKRIHK